MTRTLPVIYPYLPGLKAIIRTLPAIYPYLPGLKAIIRTLPAVYPYLPGLKLHALELRVVAPPSVAAPPRRPRRLGVPVGAAVGDLRRAGEPRAAAARARGHQRALRRRGVGAAAQRADERGEGDVVGVRAATRSNTRFAMRRRAALQRRARCARARPSGRRQSRRTLLARPKHAHTRTHAHLMPCARNAHTCRRARARRAPSGGAWVAARRRAAAGARSVILRHVIATVRARIAICPYTYVDYP
jgi:hypothetical protein